MNNALKRFEAADPARDLHPDPDLDFLESTLRLPTPRPRTKPRGRIVVPLALTATAALAVVVLIGSGARQASRPVETIDLAAQAYAMTTVAPGEIQHTFVRTTAESPRLSGSPKVERGSIEEWRRGARVHRLERVGTTTQDRVIDNEGILRQVSEDGALRISRPGDSKDAAMVIAQGQAGFVETFRTAYKKGRLDPAGNATFAGRPALRYRDTKGPGPSAVRDYYVDRRTGAPLGSVSTFSPGLQTPSGSFVPGTFKFTSTVETIETLAPTPENRAKVTTLSLPRRRDRDGCIRGPISRAQSADTAARSDCGGTPGAPIEP